MEKEFDKSIEGKLWTYAKLAPFVWFIYGAYMLIAGNFHANGFIQALFAITIYFTIGTVLSALFAMVPSFIWAGLSSLLIFIARGESALVSNLAIIIFQLLFIIFFVINILWTIFVANWYIGVNNNFFVPPVKNERSISIPAQYQEDRKAFVDSIIALNKSMDMSQPKNGIIGSHSQEKDKEIYALVEEGLSLSNNVSDEFLDYIHPELKNMYKNNLIEGTRQWYDGQRSKDVSKQAFGISLATKWIEWFERNGKDFENKIF